MIGTGSKKVMWDLVHLGEDGLPEMGKFASGWHIIYHLFDTQEAMLDYANRHNLAKFYTSHRVWGTEALSGPNIVDHRQKQKGDKG